MSLKVLASVEQTSIILRKTKTITVIITGMMAHRQIWNKCVCTWTSGEVLSWLRVNRTPRQVDRC